MILNEVRSALLRRGVDEDTTLTVVTSSFHLQEYYAEADSSGSFIASEGQYDHEVDLSKDA